MQRRMIVPALLASGALALSALTAQAAPAHAAHRSHTGMRLFSPAHHVDMTIHNSGTFQWVEFNPAVYLESRTNKFEIDVRRKNAYKPIVAVVHVGNRTRTLPRRLLAGWLGLKNAFELTWRTPGGALIAQTQQNWCPNDGTESRLGPHAATTTAFTFGCSSQPFTRGQRWGIDRGWSRQVLAYGINPPQAAIGNAATLDISLRPGLARAFGIADNARTIHFVIAVKHVTDPSGPFPGPGPAPAGQAAVPAASSSRFAPFEPRFAGSTRIPPSVLPDLIALPAFWISTHNESGHDLLDFAATVYNGGRGPLVAEGFRRGSKPVMSAYQFFYRGTKQVGSARVGTMHYDARPSHQHWHFQDFARYDLVDRNRHQVRTSGKEAFCLAPTDAIDLLQPGAVVNPGNGDLSTACGDISSIWVREVLPAGWGDTYTQARAGQSIDITNLPNGTFWIRVSANPAGRLHEASRRNNTSLREVILGGTPGHRTVRVPSYGFVNSEAGYHPGGGPHPGL